MEFLSNKPLLITDTILRDAHQSQAATRMRIEDMLPSVQHLMRLVTGRWNAGAVRRLMYVCGISMKTPGNGCGC